MNYENQPLVSIIIPVYNVESYLKRCLDSVIRQSYQNIEVIAVDDGSTDRSGEICDEYAAKDKRIRVIHEKNSGALSSRKKGCQAARGDYIGFVDADDWIDIEMYAEMIRNSEDSDIVICQKNISNETEDMAWAEKGVMPEGIYTTVDGNNEVVKQLFLKDDFCTEGISINLCDKIFKNKLLKKVIEQTDFKLRYFEDAVWTVRCMLHAEKVTICDKALYYYRQRTDSACHRQDDGYLEQVSIFYRTIKQEVERYSLELRKKLDYFIAERVVYGINEKCGLQVPPLLRYVPPYNMVLPDDRIVLYGAGMIGKDYYRAFHLINDKQVVLWVDKDYKRLQEQGYGVSDVREITHVTYTKIIIAVKEQDNARAIIAELERTGISSEKLVWRAPKTIFCMSE